MREEGALVSLTQGPFLRAVRHPLAEASGQADMGEAHCRTPWKTPIEPRIRGAISSLNTFFENSCRCWRTWTRSRTAARARCQSRRAPEGQLVLLGRNDPVVRLLGRNRHQGRLRINSATTILPSRHDWSASGSERPLNTVPPSTNSQSAACSPCRLRQVDVNRNLSMDAIPISSKVWIAQLRPPIRRNEASLPSVNLS